MDCRHRCIGCVATLALGIVARSACAIVTSDQPGSHVVAPGQTAFGVGLDGVVMIGGLFPDGEPIWYCTGALISNRHVLSAAHCFDFDMDGQLDPPLALLVPGAVDAVLFQLAGGLVAVEYEVDTVQLPDNWPEQAADIAVITLKEDAPPEVPRYPLYGRADEIGRTAVLTGFGLTGHGSSGEDFLFESTPTKRAGLNRIEAYDEVPGVEILVADYDSGLPENNSIELFGFPSDLGFGADEVGLAGGDSGGPMFIGAAIAGVNWAYAQPPIGDVNTQLDASWGETSFFMRVSSYRDFILAATNSTAVFVPEPASLWLFISGVMVSLGVFQRNRG